MALLELIDLGQNFASGYTLEHITLSIEKGEAFALIGPTGAGKTTLLRLIDLIDEPTTGQIHFRGKDVTHSKNERLKARRLMAYVQQKPAVFSMNVFDNVAQGLKWRREQKSTLREKVMRALELVEMPDYDNRDAKTLSGGETQRVAIARALVTEPELLLLDEPTANLDPVTTAKIEKVIKRIIEEKRTTVIMSTHDMALGQKLAQRIGVLMDGKLVQIGGKGDIFKRPQNMEVAGFVGMDNMLKGIITENKDGSIIVDVNGKTIEGISDYAIGQEVFIGLRPEDITLSLKQTSTSARNAFEGTITAITHSMPLANIELDCGVPLTALITVRSLKEMGLEEGSKIYASFKATSLHITKT